MIKTGRFTGERAGSCMGVLSLLVALGAVVTAGAGLLWHDGGEPFTVTSVHGETVTIYGRGLYQHDTLFKAPILRGTDAVTLFLAVPVLLATLLRHRRQDLRGRLLLAGVLAYFLYNSASVAFGAAYNPLLLVYVGYFSASLAAFGLAVSSVESRELADRVSPRVPRRLIAAFLFLAGLSVLVWLIDIVGALAAGGVPTHLGTYHTEPTYVIDLAIIAPAAFLGGILLLRRRPAGYIVAAALLVLNAFVGPVVVSQTVFQRLAGVAITTTELMVFAGTFVVTSAIAAALAVALLRSIAADSPPGPRPSA
jgi:hypothetical protein